jgi:hypothetical protein
MLNRIDQGAWREESIVMNTRSPRLMRIMLIISKNG